MELRTKITNFVDVLLEKAVHAQLGHHILESHGRLDKTMYSESSVKVVSISSRYFFEFLMLLGLVYI